MANIKFVSHEEFPEDPYTKELVYLQLNVPARVAFVRKQAKNGGQFWGVSSVGVTKDGCKQYYEAYLQDSSFLEKDIKKFLDDRSWEKGKVSAKTISDDEIPF
jgi:hypothetical protein